MITSKYSVKITRNIPKTWYHQYFPRTQPCILSKFSILPCCHHIFFVAKFRRKFQNLIPSPPPKIILACFFLSFFFLPIFRRHANYAERVGMALRTGKYRQKMWYEANETFLHLCIPPFIRPIKPCLTISILAL